MEDKELLAELRSVLGYDPHTGLFRWFIAKRRMKVGDVAGTNKDGYVQIGYTDSEGVKHHFRAHRLAFWFVTGSIPKEIDHWDRNRAHNAWGNLRDATRAQNNMNTHRLRPNNSSGKRGVSWRANRQRWLARIVINGKAIDRGLFVNLDDAIEARRQLEIEYLGGALPS